MYWQLDMFELCMLLLVLVTLPRAEGFCYWSDGHVCCCLGYIVFSGIRRQSGVQGLRVIVQSDKSPQYVEGRVEAFLDTLEVSGTVDLCIWKFALNWLISP